MKKKFLRTFKVKTLIIFFTAYTMLLTPGKAMLREIMDEHEECRKQFITPGLKRVNESVEAQRRFNNSWLSWPGTQNELHVNYSEAIVEMMKGLDKCSKNQTEKLGKLAKLNEKKDDAPPPKSTTHPHDIEEVKGELDRTNEYIGLSLQTLGVITAIFQGIDLKVPNAHRGFKIATVVFCLGGIGTNIMVQNSYKKKNDYRKIKK